MNAASRFVLHPVDNLCAIVHKVQGAQKGEGEMSVREKDWRWFGNAGHFICARWCQFHLCTQVGRWLVSTVGEYVPDEAIREIHCQVRNIPLEGCGDARLADYMKKVGFQEIGYGRTYETMVFRAGTPCKAPSCDCMLPEIDGSELDSDGYNSAGDATAGHYKPCEKWSKLDAAPEEEVS